VRSATQSKPKFRVSEWVTYRYITARILGQIVQDRGLLGYRGRRLYELRTGWNPSDPDTTTVPEEELERAPAEILSPEAAKERGISTHNWRRLEFNFRYIRQNNTNVWTALPELRHLAEGEHGSGVLGTAVVLWDREPEGDKNVANITVVLEYDPRLRDARDQPGLLRALTEQAQKLADESFLRRQRKAVIERD
jgi:hypothetical protein